MQRFLAILIFVFFVGLEHMWAQTYQNSFDSERIISFDIRQHYGFVIIHSRDIRAIKDSYPIGTEFNFNWQSIDQKSWELCHCYPKLGLLLSFFDFDNKEILGYGFNAAGFIEPVFQINKKIQTSVKSAIGLSLDTKPYNEISNPKNLSYSLPVNGYLQFGVILYYQISPKIKLALSSNYNHISNGGVKRPNKGVNYPTISMGVNYTPQPMLFQNRQKVAYKDLDKKRYYVSVSYFPKKLIHNSKYFTVFGVSTGLSRQVGRISAVTADLEWVWDNSLKWQLEALNEHKNYHRGGILVGHEFLMGKFTFSQKIGPYIYNAAKYDDPVYQRYGLDFHFTQHMFAGIHVKAHRHVADFTEIKLGWTF